MEEAVVGALSASPADALEAARETNAGAVRVLGDETLREIAREIVRLRLGLTSFLARNFVLGHPIWSDEIPLIFAYRKWYTKRCHDP